MSTLQMAYFANGEDNVADDDELFIQVLLVVGVIYIFLRHIKAAGLEHPIFGPKWAMSPHLNHRGGPRIKDNVLRVTVF